jgi:hypothetical protein
MRRVLVSTGTALVLWSACVLPISACGSSATHRITATSSLSEATAAAFPVLRRASPTAADVALRAAARQMAIGDRNARPIGVRSAYRDSHINVGIMPDGLDKACVLAVTGLGTSGGCTSVRYAYADGLTVAFNDRDGYHLAGVLPRGVRSIAVATQDGATHRLTVSRDDGFAFVSREPLKSVILTTSGGTKRETRLPPSSGSSVANQSG